MGLFKKVKKALNKTQPEATSDSDAPLTSEQAQETVNNIALDIYGSMLKDSSKQKYE